MALWVYNNAQSALNFIYYGLQVTYLSILWWLAISVSILNLMFGSRALFFIIRRQILIPPDVFEGIFEALVLVDSGNNTRYNWPCDLLLLFLTA